MNKYKKLAANTLIFSIGSFGSKILSFVLVRFYTEYLSKQQYSTANIIMQTVFLLVPIATVSIEEAVMRFGLDADVHYRKDHLYTTGFFVGMGGNILFMIIAAPFLNMIPDLKGRILLMFLCIYFAGLRSLNQQFLRARGLLKVYAFDGILTTFLLFVFNILFMAVFKWGITGYILATGAADICSCIFTMFACGNCKFIRPRAFNTKLLKVMARYSIPLIPTFILWWIVSASDTYMVRYIINADANGLYSVAYKIPTLISIVSTIFFQAWQMSAITEVNSEDTKRFYSTIFSAYQSMMYLASAGIILLLKPLTRILTSAEYYQSYIYAPMLVIAVLMSCLCQFLSGIYTATKHTKNSLWTSAIAAGINIVFNFIFIPIFGVQGAAFSTMLSYSVCFFVRVSDTRKLVHYQVDKLKIVLNLLVLAVMCYIVLSRNHFEILYLVICCFIIFLLNLRELMKTALKILHRR